MSGEFASKGMAGSALGLAIGGLSAALLQGSNNGGGILGNVLGGNNCAPQMAAMGVIAEKDAEIAQLKARGYSDDQDSKLYQATRSENEKLANQLMAFITPLSKEAADNRVRVSVLEVEMKKNAEIAEQREKNVRLELGARIDSVAQACDCGIRQNTAAIAALQNTVGGITRTIIPASAICPEVMPRWNSYTTPTNEAPATQPVSGTIRVQG